MQTPKGTLATDADLAVPGTPPRFDADPQTILSSRRPDHELLFAYGSNLSIKQMRGRAPSSRPLVAARLPGYGLAFPRFSRNRGCGVVSIVPDSAQYVWGGLYELSREDLAKVDGHEGVPTSYRRERVTVHAGGQAVEAWCHVAVPQQVHVSPNEAYMEIVRAGARDWSLPASYLLTIEKAGRGPSAPTKAR